MATSWPDAASNSPPTIEEPLINGVSPAALADFGAAVTADPKAGEAGFAVNTHWQGGSRSRAQVSCYYLRWAGTRYQPGGHQM